MAPRTSTSLIISLVLIPMLVAAAYYAFIAAERYVSESIITVRQAGDTSAAAMSGIAMLLTGNNLASREETLYLKEYIHSLDMLKHLDARLDLRAAYEAEPLDVLYRLFAGASQEHLLWYYRNRVELQYDDVAGLLKVRVDSFDPNFSHALNSEILAQSERFVNEISQRMAREQMAFAEGELDKQRRRLQAEKARLVAFQNRHEMLNPLALAEAAATLTTEMEAQIARKDAELKTILGYLQEDAHQAVAIRNELAALRAQLAAERSKVASDDGVRLNLLAADFQNLVVEAGFAEDAYKAALAAVETTRMEAGRKLKSLVVIDSPSIPETAEYPRRLYNLVTLFFGLTLLYGIVRLVLATVQDHRD